MISVPTPIYRIFHAKNLRSILEEGRFYSSNQIKTMEMTPFRISHSGIMDRRERTTVSCGSGETLADYVSFYLAPRSPMLYSIYKGNVEEFDGNQELVLYAVSTMQAVEKADSGFVFSDGHGIMALTEFFDDLTHLDKIDWAVMKARFWNDTNEQPDRKRRRQAEFLVHKEFPWRLVQEVGVKTLRMKKAAEKVLGENNLSTPVVVHPDWYY